MKVEYKVAGLDKFLKEVSRQPRLVQVIVDRELGLSAIRVEKKAKYYAAWDTGMMSTSIHSLKRQSMVHEVISPMFYSIFVELGTRKMAAQPFMYSALQEDFPVLMRSLKRIVER